MKIAYVQGVEPQPSAFERLAFASVLKATSSNKSEDVDDIITRRWPTDRTAALVAKATVAPGASGTAGWAAEVAGTAWGGFLASLAPFSVMASIMPRGTVSPFDGFSRKLHPYRSSTAAPMSWVKELDVIPVAAYTIASATLTPKKMATLTIFSRELMKHSDAEAIFNQIFREDAGLSLDAAYFSTDSATDARHAGLLNGLTAGTGYGGADAAAMQTDLAALASTVAANGSGEVVFIGSPERAALFPVRFAESKVTMMGSAAVPATRVIALDPRALVHGFNPVPDIDVSTEGTVHMSDTPLEIVDDSATVADPVRSLFQTDAIGLRCFLEIGFAKRRSNAVAFVDGVTW
ncbi:phage major capsid protein [Aestuariivirga sp.]|uniref:phage major capsid family protein n=1 Tax=Aestuariivirga sp. TaxID=2650926 RepID=UPI0035941AED